MNRKDVKTRNHVQVGINHKVHGDLANGLEGPNDIVAHDLTLRDRFMAKLGSLEVKTTARLVQA